ncbi:DUF3592 domain-containing protein [Hymenobacter oligotrophus]|uniref:DUF3592 domain-containing protein n=1 Tax=Hymenobacter oligotrophus TaxID=2319843 RepID=A0A3B7QYB2_9BACT|nr:DUF3592 domain-containing protein [Hymenobacter oligotrophus]AYA36080.1 DUF3592 domain-containing protein [Hymenobacter oligotrophus]
MNPSFHVESVVFVAMGLFFMFTGLYARRSQQTRAQRGVRSKATLIGQTPSRSGLLTSMVQFSVRGGGQITTDTESLGEAGKYTVGQEVEVIYDPQNPENADFATEKPTGIGFAVVIGLGFLVVGTLQLLGYLPLFEQE